MRALNRAASEQLQSLGSVVHAVTDVTGYGLAGHGWEMAERSERSPGDRGDRTGRIPRRRGGGRGRACAPGGDARNREYVGARFSAEPAVSAVAEALCFDPQTSGGLLAAVPPEVAADLVADGSFWRVGTFEAGEPAVALR